jgi:antitoxin Phd
MNEGAAMNTAVAWNLQDAKAQFSAVVERAMRGQVQHVRKHGKPAVVVVSAAEYESLMQHSALPRSGLADHLLNMPRVSTQSDTTRGKLTLRDVDFS